MSLVTVLLLGALLGGLGQLLRAVIGVKKAWDAAASDAKFSDVFNTQHFLVTLALGLVVGVITGLFTAFVLTVQGHLSREQILLLVASGYAGSDALEGLFTKAQGR